MVGPLTAVLTPEGKPFFAGTYFPPDDRFGRPSFQRILLSLSQAWQERRKEVYRSAENITQHLLQLDQQSSQTSLNSPLNAELKEAALKTVERQFDAKYGGFGHEPKFPPHSLLQFLLRQGGQWQEMAFVSLDKMARGGIYDQLAGGFARYSVDERWLVPHFEKMLYDNAQLIQRYSEAYVKSPDVERQGLYQSIVEETLGWLLSEMQAPQGGFYSALDADSEGEEGKYYLWDEDEVEALLGEDAKLAKAYWDISSMGNFEGRNILNVRYKTEAVAARFGLQDITAKLREMKEILLEARAKRIRPGLDDKLLCSWNGLLLSALVSAARYINKGYYYPLALKQAQFLKETFYQKERLWHSSKAGQSKGQGLLEDYAYMGMGFFDLYQLSLEAQHLKLALELAEVIEQHFCDPQGGFFSTPDDGEKLILRPKDNFDSATPSQNATAARLLLKLSHYNGNKTWADKAYKALKPLADILSKQPSGFASWLNLLEDFLKPSQEIIIVGDPNKADTQAMMKLLEKYQLAEVSLGLLSERHDLRSLALFADRQALEGKATAYICENQHCQLPINDLTLFEAHVAGLAS
ncbi:MAG: thioredoxin domain-containing protein [Deinococcales bacterium]